MALTECDLLIALGVRFDDRVTGLLSAFAPHAKVIHVDIDPAEIGKNRAPDVPIVGDVKRVLTKLNKLVAGGPAPFGCARANGGGRCGVGTSSTRSSPKISDSEIKPQHVMREIDRLSAGEAIVTTDVGQHQMWAAQLIRFNEPRLLDYLRGAGLDGLRLAFRRRRAIRPAGQVGVRHRRRRRLPDVDSGAVHDRRERSADQDRRPTTAISAWCGSGRRCSSTTG